MPQNRTKRRDIGTVDRVCRRKRTERPFRQQHRQDTFSDIAHNGERRRAFSKGAQHIGHTRVAGAEGADVLVIQKPCHDDGKAQRAKQIRGGSTCRAAQHGLQHR